MDYALHVVAKEGVAAAIRGLIEAGARVDAVDEHGLTPLIHAAQRRHIAAMHELVHAGADMEACILGKPLLQFATEEVNLLVMRVLLELGANPDVRDAESNTPLMIAARKRIESVRLLLEHGATANAQNLQDDTPLVIAAGHGCPAMLKLLLDAGADCNALGGNQRSALMRAAETGSLANMRMLLESGAALQLQRADGATALTCACEAGQVPALKALLDAGAPANFRDDNGQSALHVAASRGDIPIVYQLLLSDADVNSVRSDNLTPLIAAVAAGYGHVARFLIYAGADINASTIVGEPIVRSAIVQGILRGYERNNTLALDCRWIRRRAGILLWQEKWSSYKPQPKDAEQGREPHLRWSWLCRLERGLQRRGA
jgi:ankyrin repeat protein